MTKSSDQKEYYKHTNYQLEPAGRRKLDFIVQVLAKHFASKDPSAIKVLDFGCGKGNISLPLGSLGYQVLGVDLDQKSIKAAQTSNTFANVNFQAKDILAAADKCSFDCLIASEVIEHLPDPAAFFTFAQQNLQPGGIIIITVPNGYSLEETTRRFTTHTRIGQALKGIFKSIFLPRERIIQTAADSPHVQFFTLRRLEKIATQAKFQLISKKNQSIWFRGTYYLGARLFIKRGSSVFSFFDQLDGQLAEVLPLVTGDGWLLALKRTPK
ncbi:methyltransferase domain-containing protein [Patescibacteria group bacterium]|nr:methyltransferase domain-containing protein [Patescibacteria group bacterium]